MKNYTLVKPTMDWIKEETEVVYSGSDDRNHGRIIKVQKI